MVRAPAQGVSIMKEDEFGKMMGELGSFTAEPVRPTLADDIKTHIPSRLESHHKGMHTVNIIIDLRVSRLAAAGVVVITLVLLAGLLGDHNSSDGGGIIQGCKAVVVHLWGNNKTAMNKAEPIPKPFVIKGENVVFPPKAGDAQGSNVILMYSRLPNDKYRVTFSNSQVKEVNAGELIKLQAQMLQQRK